MWPYQALFNLLKHVNTCYLQERIASRVLAVHERTRQQWAYNKAERHQSALNVSWTGSIMNNSYNFHAILPQSSHQVSLLRGMCDHRSWLAPALDGFCGLTRARECWQLIGYNRHTERKEGRKGHSKTSRLLGCKPWPRIRVHSFGTMRMHGMRIADYLKYYQPKEWVTRLTVSFVGRIGQGTN